MLLLHIIFSKPSLAGKLPSCWTISTLLVEIISQWDFFGDFVDKVSLASHPVKTSACGGYGVNIVGKIFPKVMLSQRQLLEFLYRVTQQPTPQSGKEELWITTLCQMAKILSRMLRFLWMRTLDIARYIFQFEQRKYSSKQQLFRLQKNDSYSSPKKREWDQNWSMTFWFDQWPNSLTLRRGWLSFQFFNVFFFFFTIFLWSRLRPFSGQISCYIIAVNKNEWMNVGKCSYIVPIL